MHNIKSNFTLFFSLPFYPVVKKTNFFYNGHLALGLGKFVYNVYNPSLLNSDFFISKMPINEWFTEKDMVSPVLG